MFNHANLEIITEIGFLFVRYGSLDRLAALRPGGGVEVTASPATAHIGEAIGAAVRPHYFALQTGRSAAIPANKAAHQLFTPKETPPSRL